MLRKLKMRIAEENGIALISAMLISMVLVTLGATAVTLSLHNSEASSYDRRRVEGISAAEAGIAYYFSHLQSETPDTFDCSINKTLTATPATHFEASVVFYDAGGSPLPCPPIGTEPRAALIRSVGTSTSVTPARTMEAYVNLVPQRGAPFGQFAVFSDASPKYASNTQVFGGDTNDGNLYTNGNARIESNATIYGDVHAQGSIQLDGNAEIKGDLWAGTSILMRTNSRVRANVKAATSSVALESSAIVYGNAQAATSITAQPSQILGAQIPGTPSSRPPALSFPSFTYDQDAWIEDGYTPITFTSCALAKTFINTIPAGDYVVRITSACDLSWTAGTGPTVRGNLAIVSNGSLTMGSNSGIFSNGGTHTLRLIFGLGGATPCNITFNQNSIIAAGLKTLMYTPCVVNLSSNSLVIEGQLFAGTVNFNSNANVQYKAIDVPGVGITGFDEDIIYMREVITD
jgi:cytoskeletal protein CcmA (bactofilin family)